MARADSWVSTTLMPITSALAFSMLVLIVKKLKAEAIPAWLANYGKVSFSVYIFHFLVWHVLELILRRFLISLVESNFGFIVLYMLVAVITFGIAKLSYQHIEKRFIRLGEALISWRTSTRQYA